MTTIHSSKGLEFDAVFFIGLTQRNLPGFERGRLEIPDQLLQEVVPALPDAFRSSFDGNGVCLQFPSQGHRHSIHEMGSPRFHDIEELLSLPVERACEFTQYRKQSVRGHNHRHMRGRGEGVIG